MLNVVVGHSNDPDSLAAITEVIEQCQDNLGGKFPQAGILFAAIDFDYALILQEIVQAFPGIELIGGTTDAEISSLLKFQQDSIALMLFCADEIEIYAGLGRNLSKDPILATKQAVEQAKSKIKNQALTQLCLTFPESLTVDGVAIVEGLKLALGKDIPIFGGLTADQWKFEKTYQFFQTEILHDAVPLLIFSGKFLFSQGVASGWHPLGKKGKVTKVDKNILYEIDGKPALDFYHHYLGGLSPSGEYPLAVFESEAEEFYMRAPSIHDIKTGSITFLGEVPADTFVQIAQASRDEILGAAKTSILNALNNYPGKQPDTALFFSCAARRLLLGTRTIEEYQLAQECLTESIPGCGFYTHGEISPLNGGGETRLHHETFVTLLIGMH
ncbi:FIST C-terminal domain-containing protein [Nostoc sp. LEGE 06077]|uniref:FIST signal transduction protein n=1 Tax=Nostoc sp. LEGE 06077 TaxID=915325 RepID=UPI001881BAF0|nr:FIST N-terminal domain-containing protein [Nostoc sp. LEGE 06077]MBE9207076.1 FIST C-terminal domain-containing protein [Nostoc sp. LEGE 06077]